MIKFAFSQQSYRNFEFFLNAWVCKMLQEPEKLISGFKTFKFLSPKRQRPLPDRILSSKTIKVPNKNPINFPNHQFRPTTKQNQAKKNRKFVDNLKYPRYGAVSRKNSILIERFGDGALRDPSTLHSIVSIVIKMRRDRDQERGGKKM